MLFLTRSRFLQRFLFGLVGFLCVLLVGACNETDFDGGAVKLADAGGSANRTPVMRVATSPFFPPFTFLAADGSLQGFDIDLMNAIGEASQFAVEFETQSGIDQVIRSLYTSDIDAAIYGLTITPDRAKVVSFSRPYFKSGLAIATQAINTEITSIDTLQGKRVGVESGSTSEAKARMIPGVKVESFDTVINAFEMLKDAKVDAVINDAPVTAYMISQGEAVGVKLVGELLNEEFYGIATPKNASSLEKINEGLSTIIKNGEYEAVYRKWFEGDPPVLPEAVPQ
jgi:arginine/lysine/histidine/glutamine transport system substrate-binding and permease protein